MKQFKHKALIILLYEIVGWCYATRVLPRRIDFWIEDDGRNEFTANVYYYADKRPIKSPEEDSDNKKVKAGTGADRRQRMSNSMMLKQEE